MGSSGESALTIARPAGRRKPGPAARSVRLLVIAPFERGSAFGGSLRATAIAEGLEARGFAVDWRVVPGRELGIAGKLTSLARGEPAPVALYPRARRPATERHWPVALACHSYVARHLEWLAPASLHVVDFQNLEWRFLHSLADLADPLRKRYYRVQASVMRKHEGEVVRWADVGTFVAKEELEWAQGVRPDVQALLVPNIMPRAELAQATQIWTTRSERRDTETGLLYVGKLAYRPNALSLQHFLATAWPHVLAVREDLRLTVVGQCDARTRRALLEHPNVDVLGFVDDLRPALARALAVVLPLYAGAGSSVRTLYYALAGVPIVGSPLAFRGFARPLGRVAYKPADWGSTVTDLLERGASRAEVERSRTEALAIQEDPVPLDALAELVARGKAEEVS